LSILIVTSLKMHTFPLPDELGKYFETWSMSRKAMLKPQVLSAESRILGFVHQLISAHSELSTFYS
jgi:hypothetical protein